MATTEVRPARKKERLTLPKLRAWWRQLPQWEKELRLLRYLLDRMPLNVPVSQIVDTSDLPNVLRGEDPGRLGPRLHQPFRDPSTLHPYVFKRYVEPLSGERNRPRAVPTTDTKRKELPTYPPVLLSPEHFRDGGAFSFPYHRPADVLSEADQLVENHLVDIRAPGREIRAAAYRGQDLQSVKQIRISNALRGALEASVKKGMDAPRLYGTLFYAGTGFLTALSYYRQFEKSQADLRARVRKEKRSLRSHLAYWRDRLQPENFARLEAEAQEIQRALEAIRQPDDDAVKAYRRRLGIYRGGAKPGQHHFWTSLIGWAVRVVMKAGCTEKEACEIVATLLHEIWTKIHPKNPAAVKSRYYRTL